MSTIDLEGLDAARAAAELARRRMQLDAERAPEPASDSLARLVARVGRDAVRLRTPPPAAPALSPEQARARRLARALQALPPGRRDWCAFGRPELVASVRRPAAIEETRRAVERRAPALVWTGESGRGKTALACAAVRLWLELGAGGITPPVFAAARRLAVSRSRHPLGQGEAPDVVAAGAAPLLVVDDVGTDVHTPSSAVLDLVFDREEQGLPTWITTWLTHERMESTYGAGFARRVFERATVIAC